MKIQELLLENLGNLKQLNVGKLINVLRQRGYSGYSDERKFADNSIGHTSQVHDIGVIKPGKIFATIRTALRTNEAAQAFALYLDGEAVLFATFDYYTIRGKSRSSRAAWDLSKFQTAYDELDAEFNKYYNRIPSKDNLRMTEPSHWTNDEEKARFKPEPITGTVINTEYLTKVIELIEKVAAKAGATISAKTVDLDTAGRQKNRDRQRIKAEMNTTMKSLELRLKKYKLDKVPSVDDVGRLLEILLARTFDGNPAIKQIKFAGGTYSLDKVFGGDAKISSMFGGEPVQFKFQQQDEGKHWNYLILNMTLDRPNRTLVPLSIEYKDGYRIQLVVVNHENFLKHELGKHSTHKITNLDDKNKVVPALLKMLKDRGEHGYPALMRLVNSLKKSGRAWPELDVIERTIKQELEKEKD